ncbi:pentapeptide repeat-containing protein [filamentous cyanobacterium LEGE 11480]|uniref:Pentapeptide repeat-containing protein n=1 Tax=Romeriopsis navalis LEGE 11480 TaxID=2777977 RepID=A0A928Z3U1_9CYAN|nr:pentapeptide repeat-containing protein [Romeriopsis navalis]MBE9031039.1 pentapeptide repeat-containing protein [Romeriopsis navalis LEGE 11480]
MADEKKRTKIWRFLTTDIQDLKWSQAVDATKIGADAAKAVLDLAKKTEELKKTKADLKQLQPYVEEISSLLDVLNHPLAQIAKETIPFAPIAVSLLKLICDVTTKEPTLEQAAALVSQAAYLESLRAFLNDHPEVSEKLNHDEASVALARQIQKIGEIEIDDQGARWAILFFRESLLAKEFNKALQQRLEESGLEEAEAQNVCFRVAASTDNFIEQALADSADHLQKLVKWYRTDGRETLEKYLSIESYLQDYISPDSLVPELQQRWRVFNEEFLLPELYVPLKAKRVDTNGNCLSSAEPVDLTQWARDWLFDNTQKSQVLFIQAGPGRGKSAFCRMFADKLRREQHPRWTPILIRLRDVRVLEQDFEETLRKAVDQDFAKNDNGWLNDRNTRFIFLLDGFDELLMEGRSSSGLEDFLEQVGKFQRSCAENPEKQHRVVITGRTLSLQRIEWKMPRNLERVEIVLMDEALQAQWFTQWTKLTSAATAQSFSNLLADERCPERVRGSRSEEGLAQEPLLLYLLGAMHRDGELNIEQFAGQQGIQAKIVIYERTLDWVLTKQRPEWLNDEITELQTEDLRRILSEAGLCVVQSGGECASLKAIEHRLDGDSGVKQLLDEAQERIKDNPLRNALAAFYLQAGRNGTGSVEFIHKSFGEFLCAERIKEAIEDWSKLGGRRRDSFLVSDTEFQWEVYDLLGYGGLSPEIMEYLTAMLTASNEIDIKGWIRLFNRLNEFYQQWSSGKFIDELENENLPQKKFRRLKEQIVDIEKLDLRQVDVWTGLNILSILMILHRYGIEREALKGKLLFYPSGQASRNPGEYTTLLNQIIHYADCLCISTFTASVGRHLRSADLRGADLSSTDLRNADLRNADLRNADLRGIDLRNADLRNADLRGIDLRNADLRNADLRNADLKSANLKSTDLFNADLRDADLRSANLFSTDLRSANLRDADLRNANLLRADLGSADLRNVDFFSADLRNADLRNADLRNADLGNADLGNADLRSADLRSADLRSANLTDIRWNDKTNWEGVIGLNIERNLPEALKQ